MAVQPATRVEKNLLGLVSDQILMIIFSEYCDYLESSAAELTCRRVRDLVRARPDSVARFRRLANNFPDTLYGFTPGLRQYEGMQLVGMFGQPFGSGLPDNLRLQDVHSHFLAHMAHISARMGQFEDNLWPALFGGKDARWELLRFYCG
jgi:hypothetical protein